MEPGNDRKTNPADLRNPTQGFARLSGYGVLAVDGAEARAFLHAQLTSDIAHLETGQARLAGWCSAKGRLLASFFVLQAGSGFLLVLSRDLATRIAARLSMFVLRMKVRISDASDQWTAMGCWGGGISRRLEELGLHLRDKQFFAQADAPGVIAVRLENERYLLLVRNDALGGVESRLGPCEAREEEWNLLEIEAGRPLITAATQEQFVPQMINFEALGAVDFKKGCYPGQEVVARAQYRGQLKRRMVRARLAADAEVRAGQDLYSDDSPGEASGTVVNAAPSARGTELLVVLPIATVEASVPVRIMRGGAQLEVPPASDPAQ